MQDHNYHSRKTGSTKIRVEEPDDAPRHPGTDEIEISEISDETDETEDTEESTVPVDLYQLGFTEFCVQALELSRAEAEDNQSDKWQSMTWRFVKLLKKRPEMRHVKNGFQAAKKIPWKKLLVEEDDRDQVVNQFVKEWDTVALADGETPLDTAWRRSEPDRLRLDRESLFFGYECFLCFLRALAGLLPDREVFLPVRAVGKRMGVSPISVSRYRGFAIMAGALTITKSHGRDFATRFIIHADKIDAALAELTEQPEAGKVINIARKKVRAS